MPVRMSERNQGFIHRQAEPGVHQGPNAVMKIVARPALVRDGQQFMIQVDRFFPILPA